MREKSQPKSVAGSTASKKRFSGGLPNLPPSILDYLLRNLPPDFPLEQEIKEFDQFLERTENGPLDFHERLESFANKRKWTNDDREHFNIKSAIFKGWSLLSFSGRTSLEYLVAERNGKKEDWVYKYQCRECGSQVKISGYSLHFRGQPMALKDFKSQARITRYLSEYLYDRLEKDEALSVLTGKEIKKCPDCNKFVEFKKVRKRKQPWAMMKHMRKMNRIQERAAHGIPVTSDQFRKMDEANNAWNTVIVPKWKQLITNRLPNGAEVDGWLKQAKPYLEDIYRTFPVETKLCARPDCLNPLPRGSRKNRLYCSGQCQAIQKSRRARRK